MLKRIYNLEKLIKKNKVLVIYGPRRIGKTTLLKNFLDNTKLKYKLDSGDNLRLQDILKSQDFPRIIEYVADNELIALDEAQQIPNIGMGLKIIVDQINNIYVIATGSSSFELSQQIGEPLTGRKKTLTLYPLSQKELKFKYSDYELKEKLNEYLVFGSYPEIITARHKKEKIEVLTEITNSYLLKDILALEKIKSPQLLIKLLQLLAFQLGHQVSLNELANKLNINIRTIERYLDLLEKGFVIKRLGGFSRNLRKEVVGKSKYYFYDNGIRNAIIGQFNNIEDRDDVGALFENFVFMERIKKCAYSQMHRSFYYWRTYDGKEIDLIEEYDGKLFGYEFKWSENKKVSAPKDWVSAYNNTEYKIINRKNYLDFVL
ncbi:ATP-binding protein [Candidatus Parcubacteria bacterium]|nr:ATP-binding protein [Candidatus Parcubacteria bacterium]